MAVILALAGLACICVSVLGRPEVGGGSPYVLLPGYFMLGAGVLML